MDAVPNAPEGLLLAICERFAWPFSRVKILSDCFFVAAGIILSLLFFGEVMAIKGRYDSIRLDYGQDDRHILKTCEPLKHIAFYGKEKSI